MVVVTTIAVLSNLLGLNLDRIHHTLLLRRSTLLRVQQSIRHELAGVRLVVHQRGLINALVELVRDLVDLLR